jgi:DNA-binding IclR family transcriptional regulator
MAPTGYGERLSVLMAEQVEQATASNGQLVGSLLRGLSILDAFSEAESVLGVGQLAEKLSASKSSVSRLAATLEVAGYLERVGERGRYRLGSKLTSLGELAGGAPDLRRLAHPALVRVVAACGETAHLGILDGIDAVTVHFVDGTHAVRMHSAIGNRNRAYASAIGKCLLAGLDEEELLARFADVEFIARTPNTITSLSALRETLETVRRLGYSFDDEETELGMRCVGAPVFDHAGDVVAAVTVSGPASRINAGTLPTVSELVRSAAAEVSARAGAPEARRYWGTPPSAGTLP